jgi:hypothetical protein
VEVREFLVDHLAIDGEPLSVRHAKQRDQERLNNVEALQAALRGRSEYQHRLERHDRGNDQERRHSAL